MRDGGVGLAGELDANRSARNSVFGTDQLVVDGRHRVRRHGKSHARVRTGFGKNRRVDADHFARHIHQRPTGIAGIDRGVGLNEGLELAVGNDVAPLGRNDACGHGFLQSKGTADGEHPVANFHTIGVAELRRWKRTLHINFDNCQIGLLIHADQLGVMARRSRVFVLQLHANAICLLDHVAIGDDVTLRIDNHAGTERALADVARVAALSGKDFVKEILEGIVLITLPLILVLVRIGTQGAPPMVGVLDSGLGIDVHNARLQLFGNLGEGVGQLLRSGNRQRGRIRRLLSLLALHSVRHNRTNQNPNRQRCQNRKGVRPTVRFEAHPKGAFARIHLLPPETA